MAEQQDKADFKDTGPLGSGKEVHANLPGGQTADPDKRVRTDMPTNTAAITTGGTTGEGPSVDPGEGNQGSCLKD